MSGRAGLVLAPEARIYDHGPQHPLRPDRVLLTWDLITATGLDTAPTVEVLSAKAATITDLERVHTPAFIDATERAGHGEEGDWSAFGYGPGDNPIFADMHEAGEIVAGASIAAAAAVWRSHVSHAFNAAGGLHHAMPARASGFCVYDDPAVAITWLLKDGAQRVAYVDLDVHHGDGVQAIFWNEPRVLTISMHEYEPYLFFPGTGGRDERGGPDARGSAINVPLPANTGDDAWLEALNTIVPRAVAEFAPDVLVTQLGCDTHATDPLAQLRLTTHAYKEAAALLHQLAHDAAYGRWVATGGGGYQWARVVPRAWTLYFAEMANATADLPDELPPAWVEQASSKAGESVPTTFSEPALEPHQADEEARRVAAALVDILWP
ncbi:MAG TPA: acetoin utilization protein AcuC [Actinomycetota bacterium]|nr:acetoin utilization protein AcuC [Actinomycetota bacterium]